MTDDETQDGAETTAGETKSTEQIQADIEQTR